jgi:hypothetical protein
MRTVTVREFRERFTGEDAYDEPVEVKAYGRLRGTWYPPGSEPARSLSSSDALRHGLGVARVRQVLQAPPRDNRQEDPAQPAPASAAAAVRRLNWQKRLLED